MAAVRLPTGDALRGWRFEISSTGIEKIAENSRQPENRFRLAGGRDARLSDAASLNRTWARASARLRRRDPAGPGHGGRYRPTRSPARAQRARRCAECEDDDPARPWMSFSQGWERNRHGRRDIRPKARPCGPLPIPVRGRTDDQNLPSAASRRRSSGVAVLESGGTARRFRPVPDASAAMNAVGDRVRDPAGLNQQLQACGRQSPWASAS